jgi:hypothetical protein
MTPSIQMHLRGDNILMLDLLFEWAQLMGISVAGRRSPFGSATYHKALGLLPPGKSLRQEQQSWNWQH